MTTPTSSTTVNGSSNASAGQNAALKGATLAFTKKPPIKPKPGALVLHNQVRQSNGALAAATKAGLGQPSPLRPSTPQHSYAGRERRVSSQNTGVSTTSTSFLGTNWEAARGRPQPRQARSYNNAALIQVQQVQPQQSLSPSYVAANLAASRSVSVSPSHTGPPRASRPSLHRNASSASRSSLRSAVHLSGTVPADTLDTSSIPSTTELIGMFEMAPAGSAIPPRTKTPVKQNTSAPPKTPKSSTSVRSQRSIRGGAATTPSKAEQSVTEDSDGPLQTLKYDKATRTLQLVKDDADIDDGAPARTPNTPKSSKSLRSDRSSYDATIGLPTRRISPAVTPPSRGTPPRSRQPSRHEEPDFERLLATRGREGHARTSSEESLYSAQDRQLRRSMELRYHERMTVPIAKELNKRANNIVAASAASSIASSRAVSRSTSPSKRALPPAAPPRRGTLHIPFVHSHRTGEDKSASPAKSGLLRETLRKPAKEDSEDEEMRKRGRKKLVNKHPNKHHEGDRKRWRDTVTDRERKRYEAVWASNKGYLLTTSTPPSGGLGATANILEDKGLADCVCNLVVRDIWSRSRLGSEILGEVWDLVDRNGNQFLNREEFVCGMWLIDQRLKGRKLPVRVQDSVWRSIVTNGMLGKGDVFLDGKRKRLL
jgi:hypothetical protein